MEGVDGHTGGTHRGTWKDLTLSTSSLPGQGYHQLWDPDWADKGAWKQLFESLQGTEKTWQKV